MRNNFTFLLLAAAAYAVLVSCNKSAEVQTSAHQQQAAKVVDSAIAATISGEVFFTGTVPKPVRIDMSADPACKGQNESEQVVANDGKLANVFVYVKQGLGTGWTSVSQDIVIRQENCRYVPHVIGVTAGQTVRIENADDAMHNVHPMPRNNQEWNTAQPPHGSPLIRKFRNPELMIPVKCNQHPWMKMYVNVAVNPFFAVTGRDGSFELKGLPPGTYTIAAVHEALGEQDQQITIGPKQRGTANFSFSGEKGVAAAK